MATVATSDRIAVLPGIACESDSTETVPFDILSDFRGKYDVAKREGKIQFTWLEDEMDKAMNTVRQMLPAFGSVPKWDAE